MQGLSPIQRFATVDAAGTIIAFLPHLGTLPGTYFYLAGPEKSKVQVKIY